MPVESIEFIPCNLVNIPFNFLFCEKVTAYIEHYASPAKPRIICDFNRRDCPGHLDSCFTFNFFWHKLKQCLHAIEKSGRSIGGYYHPDRKSTRLNSSH